MLASHGAAVRRIAGVYADDAGEAQDLYQEILLQAWKSLPSFRGDSAAGTWLYRVALNTALTWRRSEAQRVDHEVPMDAVVPADGAPASPPRPSRSEEEILHSFLDSVDGPNRTVLVLYMEGLTHEEIADVTGLSASAVGVRIHRMKKAFTERYVEGPA